MIGSALGDNSTVGDVTVTWNDEAGSASLEDLHEAIELLLAQIEEAGSDVADGRIRYELQTIEEELDEDEPDGAVVRSRWKQVQKLLGPLQQVGGIAQSAEQIFTLIRTLFGGN
ncbi:MAG: hypothetical protein ACRDTE_13790 [Pseudonocardiaceae bacterium]